MSSEENQIAPTFQRRPLPAFREFKIRWNSVIVFSTLHIAGFFAFLNYFSWRAFGLSVFAGNFIGLLGISIGYHRLMAHKAFETPRAIKTFFLLCAAVSMQLGPITWVKTHMRHHARADTDEDPHTQIYGFFWGFCGWLFLSHPRIGKSKLSKQIQLTQLRADPLIVFFERHWFNIFLASFIPLYFIGGISAVLWGGCVRVLSTSYFIWTLNVTGHGAGRRDFSTPDRSTNEFWGSLISGGEGWHNNHHNFPASARMGLHWYQIDFGFYLIWLFEKIGLARNIKTPAIYAPAPTGPISLKDAVVRNLKKTQELLDIRPTDELEVMLIELEMTGEKTETQITAQMLQAANEEKK